MSGLRFPRADAKADKPDNGAANSRRCRQTLGLSRGATGTTSRPQEAPAALLFLRACVNLRAAASRHGADAKANLGRRMCDGHGNGLAGANGINQTNSGTEGRGANGSCSLTT